MVRSFMVRRDWHFTEILIKRRALPRWVDQAAAKARNSQNRYDQEQGSFPRAGNPVTAYLFSLSSLDRPIARRAPGGKAAAIPVGEQFNLLQ
jgi:hypothetical protein